MQLRVWEPISSFPKVKEKLNLLNETLEDDIEHIQISSDTAAKINTIIGDAAYSEKSNIELANKNDIKLVSKLNHSVTQGYRKKEDEFQFNKDAGMGTTFTVRNP